MPTPALGTLVQAAFRLNSRIANPFAAAWPDTQPKATPYDKIALLKHSLKSQTEFENDEVLDGNAGFVRMDRISVMPGGSIDLNAGYLGLDQILAAAMGLEKFRTSSLESPAFGISGSGSAVTGTTLVGTTGTVLSATGAFSAAMVGDWARIQELVTTPQLFDQVRKITAFTDANTVTISPSWTTGGGSNPVAGKAFAVAREFLHTYEFSKNLHGENFQDILTGAWGTALGASSFLARHGVFVVWTGFGYEEWQFCFVKKLTLKLAPDSGLTIAAELVPVYRDLANTNAQDKTKWDFLNATGAVPPSGSSFMVYERVLFPDAVFRLGAFSTSTALDASNNLPINEFELTIENPLDDSTQTTGTGLYRAESMRSAKRKIEGSFTLPRWYDNNRITQFVNETALMASLECTGSQIATGKFNELDIWMRRLRLKTPDTTIGGPNPVPEKHEFMLLQCTAESGNPAGMPTPTSGAGVDNGGLIIQTRNQNPFNAFMNQNKE